MKKLTFLLFITLTTQGFSQTDLLVTDFQTGIPLSYSIVDNDGLTPHAQVSEYASAWITVEDPENPSDTVAASTSYFTSPGTASRWLITPSLSLGAFGNFLEWDAKSHDASFPDDYLVLVSTTDAQIASFTDTIGYIIEENAEWTLRTANLSEEGYDGQTIYVAFVNVTEDGFKLYIDDIRVWKEDPVSVQENDIHTAISVYPNPSNGIIHVKSESVIDKISLFNSNGQMLLQSNEKQLNIEAFPAGIYFLHVESAQKVKTIKIVKF